MNFIDPARYKRIRQPGQPYRDPLETGDKFMGTTKSSESDVMPGVTVESSFAKMLLLPSGKWKFAISMEKKTFSRELKVEIDGQSYR